MHKCENGKDAGSGVLERSLKLWSLIIESMQCWGGHQRPGRQKTEVKKHSGSERLSDLLKQQEWWENGVEEEEEEVRRKEQVLEGLKKVAKKLQHQGSIEAMLEGASEVRRLTKDDSQARTTLALLGVIPPLVSLLDDQDPAFTLQIAALYALLNLAITNDVNKAAIVKAGAVHKMIKLIHTPNGANQQAVAEAVVANFLGLSALDSNKPIIGSSGAIPFLMRTLKDVDNNVSCQAKQDAMRALYNLSISASNVHAMLEEVDLIPYFFSEVADMEVSERILAILSNIVCVVEGRKGVSAVPDAFPILIDILHWVDSPGCQEKACYILMVMAHKSYDDRQAMMDGGVVSSLLELSLVGSTLAQKRASRILECLRVEKGKQVCGGSSSSITLSAPLYNNWASASASASLSMDHHHHPIYGRQKESPPLPLQEQEEDEDEDESQERQHEENEMMMLSQERKAVKQLVQQSLQNNMKRMVTRSNLPHDFVPSHYHHRHFQALTSKSLPF